MPVVTVVGAKGGVGTSLVATNLAVLMARSAPTTLVDLVPVAGDCDLLLDLEPERSWDELTPVADDLTERQLELCLVEHSSGLSLLAAPRRADPERRFDWEAADRLLRTLAERNGWLIVDAGSGWTGRPDPAVDGADQFILVSTLDPPALRAAARWVEHGHLSGLEGRVGLILNQVPRDHPSDAERTAASLAVPLLTRLPFAAQAVREQVHFGRAAVGGQGPFAAALEGLAAWLYSVSHAVDAAQADQPDLEAADG